MSIAEFVCELLYAGKTRAEIAGYDDTFTRWVLCRRRDEYGKLVRYDPDLPNWLMEHLDADGHWKIKNPKPFSAMFKQVCRERGLDEQGQRAAWAEWRAANPKFGVGGEYL